MRLLNNKKTSNDNKTHLFKRIIGLGAKIPYYLYTNQYGREITSDFFDIVKRGDYNILGIAVELQNIDIAKIILHDAADLQQLLNSQLQFDRYFAGNPYNDYNTPIYIALRIQDMETSKKMVHLLMDYGDKFTDLDYIYLSHHRLKSKAQEITNSHVPNRTNPTIPTNPTDPTTRHYIQVIKELNSLKFKYNQEVLGLILEYNMESVKDFAKIPTSDFDPSLKRMIGPIIEYARQQTTEYPNITTNHKCTIDTAQDIIQSEDVKNIDTFMSENKAIVMVTPNNEAICYLYDDIKNYVTDSNNWFYECTGNLIPGTDDKRISANLEQRYIALPASLGSWLKALIKFDTAMSMISKGPGIKYYMRPILIDGTDKPLMFTHTVSDMIINPFNPLNGSEGSFVSANHCQDRSSYYVYTIDLCNEVSAPRSGGSKVDKYHSTGNKVEFKKDGKTISRVVFKNKRGTKVVKYKDEWVLFSKLKIT